MKQWIIILLVVLAIASCKKASNESQTNNSDNQATDTVRWNEEWASIPGIPPVPQNDCATIKNGDTYRCDGSVCTTSCGMYMLDLDNPTEWKEVDAPVTDSNKRHVYICRCKP